MTMKWIKQPHAGEGWGALGYVELDDGKQVSVEDEGDTQVLGTSRGNRPMTVNWQSVRTLLLGNGDFAYGCPDCWYAADSPRSVFPHRNAHITPEERRLRAAEKAAADARRVVRSTKKPAQPEPPKASPKVLKPVQEKQRPAVSPVPNGDTNGSLNGVSGISDAMDALRVVLAQAEGAPKLARELAEAKHRAEVAEAELARVRENAKKLFG